MQTLIEIFVEILRFVPLVIAFYVPALIGVVIWSERAEGYRVKAALWFVIGFGLIVVLQLMFRNLSALQVLLTLGLSLAAIAAALALAALTVYRLAD